MTNTTHAFNDDERLIVPNIVIPDESATSRRLAPEQQLMLAVLEDAIACLYRYQRARGARDRAIHRRARIWLLDRDRSWPFSFERICEALDRDPDTLRRRVRRQLSAATSRRAGR